jgi:periplasmic protein TonB
MTQNNLFSRSAITMSGAFITLILFIFMSQLVKNDQIFTGTATEAPILHFLQDIPEPTAPQKIQRLQPPAVTPRPVPTSVPQNTTPGVDSITSIAPPVMPTPTETFGREAASADAMPVIQISPQYPIAAARDGKEGFVVVEFDISTLGAVINAKVIDAEPKRIFDKAAIHAIKGWKYKPKMEQGNPVEVRRQKVRLDFSLDQAQ